MREEGLLSLSTPSLPLAGTRKELFEHAREGTVKVMARRAEERETIKATMLREDNISFDRMVAHYQHRDHRWSRRLKKNPLALDLVAWDNTANQSILERHAAKERKQRAEADLARRTRRELLRKAAGDRDEAAELRAEKRRLLEERQQLFARTEMGRYNSKVESMGTPVRGLKYMMPLETRRLRQREEARNKSEATKRAAATGAPPPLAAEGLEDLKPQAVIEIMYVAERLSRDGELDIAELVDAIGSSPVGRQRFGSFTDWLGSSSEMLRLRRFGSDGQALLSLPNLQLAVAACMDEQAKRRREELERIRNEELERDLERREKEEARLRRRLAAVEESRLRKRLADVEARGALAKIASESREPVSRELSLLEQAQAEVDAAPSPVAETEIAHVVEEIAMPLFDDEEAKQLREELEKLYAEEFQRERARRRKARAELEAEKRQWAAFPQEDAGEMLRALEAVESSPPTPLSHVSHVSGLSSEMLSCGSYVDTPVSTLTGLSSEVTIEDDDLDFGSMSPTPMRRDTVEFGSMSPTPKGKGNDVVDFATVSPTATRQGEDWPSGASRSSDISTADLG